MSAAYVAKFIRPAFGYYGGKSPLCRRILELAPPHKIYVEGYAGGLSVLLNKYRSDVEVACDINTELINFYHVLVSQPYEMIERVRETDFGKGTFYSARDARTEGDEFTRAMNFLIRHRMSFSGCGQTWAEGPGKGESWNSLANRMLYLSRRLTGVSIVLRKAEEVIQEYDSSETFFYLDPPYYKQTRVSPNVYTKEFMSEIEHVQLLVLLSKLKGSVVLSGYAHPTYERYLKGWERVEEDVPATSSPAKGRKPRRTEILWIKPFSSRNGT